VKSIFVLLINQETSGGGEPYTVHLMTASSVPSIGYCSTDVSLNVIFSGKKNSYMKVASHRRVVRTTTQAQKDPGFKLVISDHFMSTCPPSSSCLKNAGELFITLLGCARTAINSPGNSSLC
jgi:hypothetical protein